jgi:hypothetical protein
LLFSPLLWRRLPGYKPEVIFAGSDCRWLFGFGTKSLPPPKRWFAGILRMQFISSGPWSRSCHPNYFGEIVLWVGVAIIAFPALRGWQFVTLIRPCS